MIKKLCFIRWFCWLLLFFTTALSAQNALNFDGVNDYVQTTYPGIGGSGARTVELWVKGANVTSEQLVMEWGLNPGTGLRFTIRLYNASPTPNGPYYLRAEVNGSGINGTTNLNDGNWHHIAVTYDNSLSTNKCKLFVDGVNDGEGNLTVSTTLTSPLTIGRRIPSLSNGYFNGVMDDFRIWDVARTEAEILANKNTEFCAIPAGLKVYYKFNEGIADGDNTAVTNLVDSAGSYQATINGFAKTGTTSNFVAGAALTTTPVTATASLNAGMLSVNTTAGATYQWLDCDNGNLPITGATSASYTPTFSGSFAVKVSLAADCYAVSACTPVTVTGCNINPTLSATATTATALQTGASYQWIDTDNANAPVAGATAVSFTPSYSSHYAVIITTSQCTVTSASVLLCGGTPTVSLSGTTLTALPAGGTYQWMDCATNTAVAGATAQTFTPTIDGNYSVTVTLFGSCTSTSACTQVTLPSLPNGLAFDGTSDYVQTTYAGITGGGARTVEVWIKIPTTNAAARTMVDWGSSTARFGLGVTAANKLQIYISSSNIFTGATSLNDGNWHHVAVTYDPAASTNKVLLYVDGVQDGTGNPATVATGTTTKVRMGYTVSSTAAFNATMDEVRIWDVVRTQAEIAGAKDAELCIIPTSLKAYYKFNKGVAGGLNTGQTILPDSAGANPGTLTTFALTGTASNWVAGAPVSGVPTAAVTLTDATLTVNTTAGATYQWVDCGNSNAPVSGQTATTFTPAANGNYAVIVTASTGCSITSNCTQVTIAPACIIDNTVTLNGTTLTATQAGATYQWVDCDNSNAAISGATNATYTPTASGNYAVQITMGAGCTATSSCTQVCIVNNAVTLAGTTLTAAQTGATYQWVNCADNTNIIGATNAAYTPTATGNYKVVVTMGTCTATSACTAVTICNVNNAVTLAGTTLTATQTGATYQWVDCNNSNAAVAGATAQAFTPVITGNYAVTITDANNCTATSACTQVTVTVCNLDNTVTLNAGTLTATQGGAAYQWVDCANNTNISGATNAAFTPTAAGSYKVVITAGACTTTSVCTSVTPCSVNASVTLSGTTLTAAQAGAAYQWIDCANDTNVSGATAQAFTPTATGSYKVLVTMPNNCTALSACTAVTICNVNNAVTLAGTTLTAAQAGASYQWIDCANGNTPITGATSISYTPTVSGNYAVIISAPNSCTATSACTPVTVCNVNAAVTLNGTTLTATQAGAAYQWVNCTGNTNITGATAQTYTPTATGNYKVVVTMGTCTATSACTQVTIPTGPVQNALNFDGTNDFVMTVYNAISSDNARTVEAWIKIPANNTVERMIVDWGSSTARFGLSISSENKLKIATSGSTSYTANTSITDGNWHHVAVTYDPSASTDKIKLFLDGVQDGTANPASLSTATTLALRIGYAITDQYIFSGLIDEVRIWNVARTQAEISGAKDIDLCVMPASLKAYYKFNQGVAGGNNISESSLHDSAGTNDGTILNFARTGATSNWVAGTTLTGSITATATLSGTTLTANTIAGAAYQWVDCANSNAPVSGATLQTFTPVASGIYAVIVSNLAGCSATSSCVAVTVTGCNLNDAVTLSGTTLTATQAGATYQWVNCANNSNISGATAQTYTPAVSGSYKVIITAGSCTVTSACTQVTIPVIQNGLRFDGTNDYIQTTYPGITGTGARTVEAWINVPANNTATRFITDWGTTSNKFALYVSSTNKLQLGVTSTVNVLGNVIVADGTWHHVAVTFDNSLATDKVKLYVDGVLSSAGDPTTAINTGTGNNLRIGIGVSGSGYFNGTIDEVRVWNVARTQAELQSTMNIELCTNPANLVAYYNFNQGVAGGTNTGLTTLTNSLSSQNGTLTGPFALTGATSNWVTGAPAVVAAVPVTATVSLAVSTLTANTVAGATYQWIDCSNANAPISGATSAVYTPVASGNYAVVISVAGGCSATSACTAFTMPVCNINPAVTLSGTTLTATQTGATYQWVDCANANAPVSGASAASFTPLVSGNYAVIITMWPGCTVTSACTAVTVTGCNINPAVTLSGATITAAQAGASYQWIDCANGNTPITGATSISYTPTVSGNYAVIISAPNSCTVTSACTAVCVVNPSVTLSGTTLTATQAGAAYQWVNCTGNTNITGATAQTYTPTVTGTYKVIITMPNTCTATSTCTSVTVCNVNTTVTLSGTTLTAAQTGAAYQWVNCADNTNITGATAATYTPTVSGSYKVIITMPNTCTATSACTPVLMCNVNTTVTLSGTTLTAAQTGASYQWVNCADNTNINGATAASYTPTATGSYKVVITMPNTCTATSACTTVIACNINSAVVLSGTTLTVGQAGATYQWVNCANGNPVSGASAQSFTPTATGSYRVVISMPGGCTATSACTQVSICNVNNEVTLAGTTLTATQTGATYQWVNCADNSNITGATAQNFTPTVTGSYKVVVTMGTCTATSSCTQVLVCNVNSEVTLNGTTLTATQTGASYQWIDCANDSTIAGATAQTFTPTATGNYKVMITLPDACTATSACTLVTICNLNDAVTLAGTTLTAAQAGASYQWINCADNTAVTGANAQAFTPAVTGNYAVIISTPDNCTTTSACTEVTICNVVAGVNNNAGTLMAVVQTNAAYQWIDCGNNNTPINGATGTTFTPTVSGSYALMVTIGGCSDTSDCQFVCALSDVVTVSGSTLTAAQAGAMYQWINCADNTAVTGANGQSFTPAVGGSYSVIITTPDDCTLLTDCYDVCVADNTVVNNGGTLVAMQEGATYQWINCADNSAIEGATAQSFTPTVTGNYAVQVWLSNECTSTSDCEEVTVLGRNGFDFGHAIQLYPNPTTGLVTITMGDVYDAVTMTVYNIAGQVVNTQAMGQTQTFTADLSNVARGVYFIDIKTGTGQSAVLKVIRH